MYVQFYIGDPETAEISICNYIYMFFAGWSMHGAAKHFLCGAHTSIDVAHISSSVRKA